MMFWAYNGSSSMETILLKEDLSLKELLDHESILQELKSQNMKLLEFLVRPEVIEELVTLITKEPSVEIDEEEKYKYANIACEVLSCDVPLINERIASDPTILDVLYSFLEQPPPLNPLLSSYFSRLFSVLLTRKSDLNWCSHQLTCLQVLEFLNGKENFILLLIKHIGTSAMMDLILNLVTLLEGEQIKTYIYDWFHKEKVIENLIHLFNSTNSDIQSNSMQLISDIVRKLRDNQRFYKTDDPILTTLESNDTCKSILETILKDESPSEISLTALSVLLIIAQPNGLSEANCRQVLNYSVHDSGENFNDCDGLGVGDGGNGSNENMANDVLRCEYMLSFVPYIERLHNLLSFKEEAMGKFGRGRLDVIRFMTMLMSLNVPQINIQFIALSTPKLLLDLFFRFPNNNLMHTEVERFIAYSLDYFNDNNNSVNADNNIFIYMLENCELIEKILNKWKENEEEEFVIKNEMLIKKIGSVRKGYMGHLSKIACMVYMEQMKNATLKEYMEKHISEELLKEWSEFSNNTLNSLIDLYTSPLGGIHPRTVQTSSSSQDYESSAMTALQPSFKDISSGMNDLDIDSFQDDDFNVNDDSSSGKESEMMFHEMCAQKWQSFNDVNNLTDQQECIWSGKNYPIPGFSWNDDEDSMDDTPDTPDVLDTSPDDPWAKIGSVNPWSNNSNNNNNNSDSSSKTQLDANWANFDELTSSLSFCNSTFNCTAFDSSGDSDTQDYSLDGQSESLDEEDDILFNQFGSIGQKCTGKNDDTMTMDRLTCIAMSENDDKEEEEGQSNNGCASSSICDSLFPSKSDSYVIPPVKNDEVVSNGNATDEELKHFKSLNTEIEESVAVDSENDDKTIEKATEEECGVTREEVKEEEDLSDSWHNENKIMENEG